MCCKHYKTSVLNARPFAWIAPNAINNNTRARVISSKCTEFWLDFDDGKIDGRRILARPAASYAKR